MRTRNLILATLVLVGLGGALALRRVRAEAESPDPTPGTRLEPADPTQHFGAAAAADAELADRIAAEEHGDTERAQERFAEDAAGPADTVPPRED